MTCQAVDALLTAIPDTFQLNVLIDDSAIAVLCDFGLSRVKVDTTSGTARLDGIRVIGGGACCLWTTSDVLGRARLKSPGLGWASVGLGL